MDIANDILTILNNGGLKYISPIWPPKFTHLGILENSNGDPNFWDTGAINNPATATHGITNTSILVLTNQ